MDKLKAAKGFVLSSGWTPFCVPYFVNDIMLDSVSIGLVGRGNQMPPSCIFTFTFYLVHCF